MFTPLRIVALACALPLTLAACSAGSSSDASASAERIVTGTKPAAAESTTPAPTMIGGPAVLEVAEQVTVTNQLTAPWDIEVTADGSLLVSERDSATISRVRAGVRTALNGPGVEALRGMVDADGEGGLLGLAISAEHPEHIYAYITREDDNAIVRLDLHDDLLGLPTVVLEGIPAAANHDGGRIKFGPDGYLYVSTGDAGEPELAAESDNFYGKILRVVADGSEADGTAAPDNPFGTRVWSYGHRNVEGFGWVADGRMYASELGANAEDELNLIVAGGNYGWPAHEGMSGAPEGTSPGDTVDGVTYPVVTWTTSEASPSGVAVTYEGIYVAALRGEQIWRIPLTEDGIGTPHTLLSDLGRMRDVAVAPNGTLYALTSNTDGRGEAAEGDDLLVRLTLAEPEA
ncbi:PQQ-dependent sugar dehydrogenase [Demequina lignilytica]|uniref:PQQ-dependent sugar dehydrogenase n=1 Tax=Demequina lignilytica TaxID=3051663 RepID=A0AB35MIX9_9MICO|nr:PQQ-dependent sugar dehydrogenase [Demequina sp. SYSU T0a273]MDN4483779.1 PQQ-dependent sugar dehydrogenase [Demequina sp. SYSU T0a273]